MQEKTKYLFLFLVCVFSSTTASAQLTYFSQHYTRIESIFWSPKETNAREVERDNELERNESPQESVIPSNPLMLDGKKLDYGDFSLTSTGTLTLVKSEPVTGGVTPIPFYVYIRRNGKVLSNKKLLFANKILDKIDLYDIFSNSKVGDLLIIKPARAEDWRAKRILKLIGGGC